MKYLHTYELMYVHLYVHLHRSYTYKLRNNKKEPVNSGAQYNQQRNSTYLRT